jgi:uncharacterized membrane protein
VQLPGQLQPLEDWLVKRSQGGFLLKDLCFVDFFLAEHLDQIRTLIPGALDGFPQLIAYTDRFFALPEIVEFRTTDHAVKLINNKMAYLK